MMHSCATLLFAAVLCPVTVIGEGKHAFVTLIAGADVGGYVNGAVALSHSLDAVASSIPRVCMVTPDVPPEHTELLRASGFDTVAVSPLECNASDSIRLIRKTEKYNNLCTKIQAWTLESYDKLVFLDADALVLRNVDHLFDTKSDFAIAPDSGCPEHGNTGVFVLTPSTDVYATLLELNGAGNSFDATDQGLLNSYCSAIGRPWYFSGRDDPTCTRLPMAYNLNIDYTVDYQALQFGTRTTSQNMLFPHIVQFAGARVQKPWTAFANAMALFSEANNGLSGGYIKPDYIYDEWWNFYLMWMYALAGDSSTFVAMATADPYSQVAATLHQPDNDDSIEADEDEWDD